MTRRRHHARAARARIDHLESRLLLAAEWFPVRQYDSGAQASQVVTADFNNDGRLDSAVVTNDVLVYLNTGDGQMAAPVTYAAGSAAKAVRAADVTGDGFVDLIIARPSMNVLSILRNKGNGTFDAPVNVATGNAPSDVAVADLDGDTRLDLVAANKSGGNVSVIKGTASGFAAAVNYTAGSQPSAITLADLNNDGKPEIVVANFGGNNISVLQNNGSGVFAAPTHYGVGGGPMSIGAADLNTDGKPDLFTANQTSKTVSVLYGTANGFAAAQSFAVSGATASVVAVNLNGDNKPDLAAGVSGSAIAVLINNGNSMAQPVEYANGTSGLGTSGVFLAAGDINGDGANDLLASNAELRTMSVMLGNGDGTMHAPLMNAAYNAPSALASGDLNGDGLLDIVAASYYAVAKVSVYIALGNGLYAPRVDYPLQTGGGKHVVVADLNGDNKLDIAATNIFYQLEVLTNKGNGTFNDAVGYNVPGTASPSGLVAVDVNHDNRKDLITAIPSKNQIAVFLATAGGSFAAGVAYPAGNAPAMVAAGDVTGDGEIDIVVPNTADQALSILPGSGSGSFGSPAAVSVPFRPDNVALANLDADNKLDLLATGSSTQDADHMATLINAGSGLFNSPVVHDTLGAVISVTAADFNGDGRPDVAAVASHTQDILYSLVTFTNNGSGGLTDRRLYGVQDRGTAVIAANFGADARNDLAVAIGGTFSAQRVAVYLNRGAVTAISGTVFNDPNSNGAFDAAETGVAGMTVYLDQNQNGVLDPNEVSDVTDSQGRYSFTGLPPSTYHVRQVLPGGYRKTLPLSGTPGYDFALSTGQIQSGKSFGITRNIYLAGKVFNDVNNNGQQDAGEAGIAGVVINIVSNLATVATRVTDASGFWQVKGLGAGSGFAKALLPAGYSYTNPANGQYSGSMSSGQQNGNLNFGLRKTSPAPTVTPAPQAILNDDDTSLGFFADTFAD